MAQSYDSVSKYVIFEYPEAIAELAFGDQNVEIEGSLATEQFTVKARHIDIALKVRLPDGTRGILHIEVQTRDSREPMLYRQAITDTCLGSIRCPSTAASSIWTRTQAEPTPGTMLTK